MAEPDPFLPPPQHPQRVTIRRADMPDGYAAAFGFAPRPAALQPIDYADAGQGQRDSAERVSRFYQALVALTPRADVTRVVLLANIGVFVAMVATGVSLFNPRSDDLLKWGANLGIQTTAGQWWRLFTAMFLHIGLIHLAMNMYVLWAVGPFVERLLGRTGFALAYVLSGLCGSVASAWRNPEVVSAGASGAIFGLFGALLGFVILRRDSIPMQAMRGIVRQVLLFVGLNVFLGITQPHIDMAAHLGGLVGGFFCGLVLSQPITMNIKRRRLMRNAILLVAGSVALTALAARLPRESPVRLILPQLDDLLKQAQAVDDNESAWVEAMRPKLLSQWAAARQRVASIQPQDQQAELLGRFMDLQQQEWELRLKADDEGDDSPATERALRRLHARALEALRAFKASQRQTPRPPGKNGDEDIN